MSTTIDELLAGVAFSEDDVLAVGIRMVSRRTNIKNPLPVFHSHFGSTPFVLADQFTDLQVTDVEEAKLTGNDNSLKGLQAFLRAHYWLWTRPKNAEVMASHLGVAERYCRGEPLWRWVRKIAALKEEKILWDDRTDAEISKEAEEFTVSVDGTDFRIWEPSHPTRPMDKSYNSHKFKNASLRYELGISIKTGRCVWINGPFPAGTHDMTIFRKGLKHKIQAGEAVIADRGYQTSRPDEAFMSTPNNFDEPEVDKFKSRARCRHETFNGRIKHYGSMEQTWKHSQEKHKWALHAVVVTIQYHLLHSPSTFTV